MRSLLRSLGVLKAQSGAMISKASALKGLEALKASRPNDVGALDNLITSISSAPYLELKQGSFVMKDERGKDMLIAKKDAKDNSDPIRSLNSELLTEALRWKPTSTNQLKLSDKLDKLEKASLQLSMPKLEGVSSNYHRSPDVNTSDAYSTALDPSINIYYGPDGNSGNMKSLSSHEINDWLSKGFKFDDKGMIVEPKELDPLEHLDDEFKSSLDTFHKFLIENGDIDSKSTLKSFIPSGARSKQRQLWLKLSGLPGVADDDKSKHVIDVDKGEKAYAADLSIPDSTWKALFDSYGGRSMFEGRMRDMGLQLKEHHKSFHVEKYEKPTDKQSEQSKATGNYDVIIPKSSSFKPLNIEVEGNVIPLTYMYSQLKNAKKYGMDGTFLNKAIDKLDLPTAQVSSKYNNSYRYVKSDYKVIHVKPKPDLGTGLMEEVAVALSPSGIVILDPETYKPIPITKQSMDRYKPVLKAEGEYLQSVPKNQAGGVLKFQNPFSPLHGIIGGQKQAPVKQKVFPLTSLQPKPMYDLAKDVADRSTYMPGTLPVSSISPFNEHPTVDISGRGLAARTSNTHNPVIQSLLAPNSSQSSSTGTDSTYQSTEPAWKKIASGMGQYAMPAALAAFNLANKSTAPQKPFRYLDAPVRPIEGMDPSIKRQAVASIGSMVRNTPNSTSARMNSLSKLGAMTQGMNSINQLNTQDASMYGQDKARYYNDLDKNRIGSTDMMNRNIDTINRNALLTAQDKVKRRAEAVGLLSKAHTDIKQQGYDKEYMNQAYNASRRQGKLDLYTADLVRQVQAGTLDKDKAQAMIEAKQEEINNQSYEYFNNIDKSAKTPLFNFYKRPRQ